MKTIEIDNLILVEVPKDAVNFEIGNNLLYGSTLFYKINNAKYSGTDIIKGNFEIIGLIETPDLNFDFKVDDSMVKNIGNNPIITGNAYPNYINKYQFFETKKESFKSRIEKAIQDDGLYLVNPISNPFYIKQIGENMRTSTYIADWQFKEKKTIKGNLLLIKKLK